MSHPVNKESFEVRTVTALYGGLDSATVRYPLQVTMDDHVILLPPPFSLSNETLAFPPSINYAQSSGLKTR